MSNGWFNRARTPLLIVISGVSGAGKDSIIQRMKERQLRFHFVVTATTRPPRASEVDGRDYFFYSKDQFAELIEKNELLEYAVVYGDYKGVPKPQVRAALASGLDVVMRVDVQGAAKIRSLVPGVVTVFVSTASEEELVARLRRRNTETEDSLKLRLAMAHAELERVPEFDYLVVNPDGALDETVDKIVAIIEAEHCRALPRQIAL